MMKTAAVILAGGKSRRMGRDKAMLPIHGRPLISILANRWRNIFDELLLSVDHAERFDGIDLGDVRLIEDLRPAAGPMAGLETVIRASSADLYFLTAVDLPFGDPALARILQAQMGGADVCLIRRTSGQPEPLFALYSRRCLPAITAALERDIRSFQHGLLPFVSVHEVPEAVLPGFCLEHVLLNVNTPESWRRAERSPFVSPSTGPVL